jgi:FAD/FMN-containing dehydrogenase
MVFLNRCTTVSGDIASEVPAGGDAYLLKSIVHGVNDETAVRWLRRYTGAASRVAVGATAFPHRAEPYPVHVLACWTEPSDDDQNIAWADALWRALRPYSRGAVYANFLGDEGEQRVRAAYGDNYDRLVEVKRTYDPANMFRLNNNIDHGGRPRMAGRHPQLASDMEVSSHDSQHE